MRSYHVAIRRRCLTRQNRRSMRYAHPEHLTEPVRQLGRAAPLKTTCGQVRSRTDRPHTFKAERTKPLTGSWDALGSDETLFSLGRPHHAPTLAERVLVSRSQRLPL